MNPLDRTFHPDEANQAFTVGRLLETGVYNYRPTDHHGPALYYAAAPIQHFAGHNTTGTLDPTLLRATPLTFAVLSLVFAALAVFRIVRSPKRLLAINEPPPPPSWLFPLSAVLLLGTSPLFVFFATDFIQEMLLTCFLMMMFWAAIGFLDTLFPSGMAAAPALAASVRRPSLLPLKPGSWAMLFGGFTGLAFATKETCVISFGAAVLASLPFLPRLFRTFHKHGWPKRLGSNLVLGILSFTIVSVIFYSSFGRNWSGVKDAFITAPISYLHRAAGDAVSEGASWHLHPWWQYFDWLFHHAPFEETLLFTFPTLLVPALLCLARCFRPRQSPHMLFADHSTTCCTSGMGVSVLRPTAYGAYRFSLVYSIILIAVYCLIPYKTPWCALQFLPGLVLATVFGIRTLQQRLPLSRTCHVIGLFAIVAAIIVFRLPALQLVWSEPDSPKIPFNYANASPEVQQLAHDVATALKQSRPAPGSDAFVAVALPATDTWPFPFYNRAHEAHTGYWTSFKDLQLLRDAGLKPTAVIVPLAEGHLAQALFPELSHTRRYYIRPGVRVRLFW